MAFTGATDAQKAIPSSDKFLGKLLDRRRSRPVRRFATEDAVPSCHLIRLRVDEPNPVPERRFDEAVNDLQQHARRGDVADRVGSHQWLPVAVEGCGIGSSANRRSSFNPSAWLFSGWNCVAYRLSFQIIAQNGLP